MSQLTCNMQLTALGLLTYMAFSWTEGANNSLVAAFPSPSVSSQSTHHNIRHHKHRYFWVPNLECPYNQVRSLQGKCLWLSARRDRRSIFQVPKIDPCRNMPGYTRNHDGGCSPRVNRNRRSPTFPVRKESKIQPAQCPIGYYMNTDGFCLKQTVIHDPIDQDDAGKVDIL